MTKARQKPSFDIPAAQAPEDSGWAYRSEDEPVARSAEERQVALEPVRAPASRPVKTRLRPAAVLDAVTYPFALVTTIVLFPVARIGAWFRR